MSANDHWDGVPGAELVREGIADLQRGAVTEAALLVLLAEPRLDALGIPLPAGNVAVNGRRQHALYSFLEERYGRDAYSRYNSLIRRIVSFTRALEREQSAKLGSPQTAGA